MEFPGVLRLALPAGGVLQQNQVQCLPARPAARTN